MPAERPTVPIRPEMRSRYPADWKLRSRFVRFYRAKNRCEWCGVPNGAYRRRGTGDFRMSLEVAAANGWEASEISKVVLTVAHVHDHRPEAASLLNLAALCQRCHNRHDAAMRRSGRLSRLQKECLPGFEGMV